MRAIHGARLPRSSKGMLNKSDEGLIRLSNSRVMSRYKKSVQMTRCQTMLRFSRVAVLNLLVVLSCSSAGAVERARGGLQTLYDFASETGDVVSDRAGVGKAADLRITNLDGVARVRGSVRVFGEAQIKSDRPPARLVESIRRGGELTLEAWITPASLEQSGPARIVSISEGGSQRNITLGQDGDKFDIRLRTTQTSVNGIPSLALNGGSVTTNLTHIVYTRDRSGLTRVFLNGEQVEEKTIGGSTEGWEMFRITLADEFGGNRQWRGTYHLVAMYSRDLLPSEVAQNFAAGPDYVVSNDALALSMRSRSAQLFEDEIAPMLAKHCLECHDSATAEGELDLSKKAGAFAGGSGGEVIEPGNSMASYLWESVDTNEMPEDRTPLSRRQKELLKEWIDEGAEWTMEEIDPVIYEHSGGDDENWLRRLTVSEYVETVRAAVGVDISKEARELLPKDMRADGFSNTAYNLNVDMGHVAAYAQLASIIADRMDVPAFMDRFSKNLKFTDSEMGRFISRAGRWLLRGPLEESEVIAYRGISTTVASAGGTLDEAVQFIVEAMLQSPRFIYRIENQQGDGSAWPVDKYELASRLSYAVWGGPPDEELFRAAEENELYDNELLLQQIERMLAVSRAVDRSVQFISEWLNLNRLANLRPSPEKFPNWDPAIAEDMRLETIEFFKEVVWNQKRPMADLLNADVTFATGRLAEHYGIPAQEEGLKLYDLSEIPSRGGLLTQGSVLTVGGDDASMVTRGLFVLHDLLRGTVKDPPPGLDTTPVPSSPGKSNRVVSEGRIENKNCGGCHAKFEPLAFAFEKYDGLGTYHESDEFGNRLREDGEILIPGDADARAYSTVSELMDFLAGSDRVRETLTWKLAQFVLGRPVNRHDLASLKKIHADSQEGGGTYQSLLKAILMSDLVRTTRTESREVAMN